MSDVFDEINDDLRHAELKKFWKENGSWIIGSAVAAVLLTAVLSFWRQWEYSHDASATTELTRIVAAGDAAQLEDFSKGGRKNQAMIAAFAAAGMHLERGEKEKAVAIYNSIGGTFGLDKTWRDLAKILSITQRLDQDDPEKLKKEIRALTGENSSWRYTAREMEALLAARQNNMKEAVEALTKIISDPSAPADVRTRAFTLRELYAADVPKAAAKDVKG